MATKKAQKATKKLRNAKKVEMKRPLSKLNFEPPDPC